MARHLWFAQRFDREGGRLTIALLVVILVGLALLGLASTLQMFYLEAMRLQARKLNWRCQLRRLVWSWRINSVRA